ncbi:uncharacterized protein LOC122872223 [Siniperca chuatsi]|uniref:uncharacterized protein LOC122872223 n=1 Tax=Siniperca chuatsi TaxID=119488 RepID=UPI001CE0D884|nr:uncharacterized protein LOC122872223 [Siniperca chuatsi]
METDAWDKSRTVVVSGVPDVLPVSRMTDKLTIHFQSCRRSHGGDVEVVRYPTNMDGVAFVAFDKAEDAERVVRKEQQIMTDDEFPENYLLTVFPFTRDVFLYVPSAMVDLSVFGGDQASLIQSLQSAHRSLRFRPLLQQRRATIEGPFTAVQALREDLIRRASRLKSTILAPAAAVKLRETPLNPRVISHHKFVGSVSCSRSKAKLEPASSNSLSTPLQTTGEGTDVQSLLSNAKTQNASSRQKVSYENLRVGSFCDTQSDEKREQRAWPRLEMPTEYGTERAKANPRQALREEINAGIRASLSGMDLLPAEGISAKNPGEDNISQKHTRPDGISATKPRRESHLGSHYSRTDYPKESPQSSSAVTAKLLQTGLKDVAMSSESDTRAICPEDTCIWVDSDTFRYIAKFDKKEFNRCLRGLDVTAEYVEGTDLVRILLTEKQTSKTSSRIQQALEDLKTLVEFWMSTLRVHRIYYEEEEQPEKKKLLQICDDVNIPSNDILYMLEDSYVKVIGPSVSSHLFYKRVEDRISRLKGTLVNP